MTEVSTRLRVGELYQLIEQERTASKSEFSPWELMPDGWKPASGWVDVKRFQHGLMCIEILEEHTKWRGRNKTFMTGIFLVGDQFVVIGNDYIERAE